MTSISRLRASTLRVAYGISKAGLAHLTKQQAAELGGYGIRVNAVAAGPADTAMDGCPWETRHQETIGLMSARRLPAARPAV